MDPYREPAKVPEYKDEKTTQEDLWDYTKLLYHTIMNIQNLPDASKPPARSR